MYEQINYEHGLYFCQEIPRQLNNGKSFEDKLKIGASIANQFTKQYWEDFKNSPTEASTIEYRNPSAMGLADGSNQLFWVQNWVDIQQKPDNQALFIAESGIRTPPRGK